VCYASDAHLKKSNTS